MARFSLVVAACALTGTIAFAPAAFAANAPAVESLQITHLADGASTAMTRYTPDTG